MEFRSNLLQITIGTNGIIYDLDLSPIEEVHLLENIDTLAKPEKFCNTGCINSYSYNALLVTEELVKRRVQVFTNENVNLIFVKSQIRKDDDSRKMEISGWLYHTYSELDLYEMHDIHVKIRERKPIGYIDPQSILCNYEGHSIFSLFYDRI